MFGRPQPPTWWLHLKCPDYFGVKFKPTVSCEKLVNVSESGSVFESTVLGNSKLNFCLMKKRNINCFCMTNTFQIIAHLLVHFFPTLEGQGGREVCKWHGRYVYLYLWAKKNVYILKKNSIIKVNIIIKMKNY